MNESPYFGNVTLQNYVNQEDITFNIDADVLKGGDEK
jgi:hypothetical protein